jgi:hypothetical protein
MLKAVKDGGVINPFNVYVASNSDLVLEFRRLEKNTCYNLSIINGDTDYIKIKDDN